MSVILPTECPPKCRIARIPGGGALNEVIGRPPPPQVPSPYPFIPFLTEKVSLSYTFHSKMYPFHIPMERLLLKFSLEETLKILG